MSERYENMDDDLDTISQEGWDARLQFMDFSDNPYTRDTVEWEAWRKGWVEADVRLRIKIFTALRSTPPA